MSNKITNNSGDRKYFNQTPMIVWMLCDDPYEYALWNTIKMITGEDGECYLSTEDLASLSMMSVGKVSTCRKSLLDKGLLEGEKRRDPGFQQQVWHIRIPDLWEDNIQLAKKYSKLKEKVEYKKLQQESLHHMKPKPSPREGATTPHEKGTSLHEGATTPREGKNNQKELKKKKGRTTGNSTITEQQENTGNTNDFSPPFLKAKEEGNTDRSSTDHSADPMLHTNGSLSRTPTSVDPPTVQITTNNDDPVTQRAPVPQPVNNVEPKPARPIPPAEPVYTWIAPAVIPKGNNDGEEYDVPYDDLQNAIMHHLMNYRTYVLPPLQARWWEDLKVAGFVLLRDGQPLELKGVEYA